MDNQLRIKTQAEESRVGQPSPITKVATAKRSTMEQVHIKRFKLGATETSEDQSTSEPNKMMRNVAVERLHGMRVVRIS